MTRRLRPLPEELDDIEATIYELTQRLAEIRVRTNTHLPAVPTTGDRVQIIIPGVGPVEGIVVGRTPQRIKVRVPGRRGTYLRAPHNVTIL